MRKQIALFALFAFLSAFSSLVRAENVIIDGFPENEVSSLYKGKMATVHIDRTGGFFIYDSAVKTSDGQIHYDIVNTRGQITDEWDEIPEQNMSRTFHTFPDAPVVAACYYNMRICETAEQSSCKPADPSKSLFYDQDFKDGSIVTNLPIADGLESEMPKGPEKREAELCHAPSS